MASKKGIWKAISVTVLSLLILGLMTVGHDTGFRFSKPVAHLLNSGWTSLSDGKAVSLPEILPGKKSEPVVIKRVLGSEFDEAQVLCVRGSLQTIEVKLDGKIIYQNIQPTEGPPYLPRISVWNMIRVPEGSAGSELTMSFMTNINSLVGHFGDVMYGQENEILRYLMNQYGRGTPLTFLIFSVGLMLFILPFTIKKYKSIGLAYLGLFAMAISTWFFAESKLLQFYTGNYVILAASGCIMLYVFPIPLLLYISKSVVRKTRKYFAALAGGFAFLLGLVLVLQLGFGIDIYRSLIVAHLWMGVSLVVTVICMTKELREGNEDVKSFIWALMPLVFFASLEMLGFYLEDFHKITQFSKVGLLMFLLIQAMDSVALMIKFMEKSSVAELYERLAFEDKLTGGLNRMAFERDMVRLFRDGESGDRKRLTIFDLNHLKRINDTYGHIAGDDAIRTCYRQIEGVFGPHGSCYRLGGDEFASVCGIESEGEYLAMIEELKLRLKHASGERPYLVSVAAGSVVFDPEQDDDVSKFLHRADMNMYLNKLSEEGQNMVHNEERIKRKTT